MKTLATVMHVSVCDCHTSIVTALTQAAPATADFNTGQHGTGHAWQCNDSRIWSRQ
jgi:hypothetical protein